MRQVDSEENVGTKLADQKSKDIVGGTQEMKIGKTHKYTILKGSHHRARAALMYVGLTSYDTTAAR